MGWVEVKDYSIKRRSILYIYIHTHALSYKAKMLQVQNTKVSKEAQTHKVCYSRFLYYNRTILQSRI